MSVDSATPHGSLEPPATRTGTIPVVEVFHSIQGEGSRTGEPATFIRLAGCNLRCSWCDTPYSWSSEGVAAASALRIDEIAEQVRERSVVLTGGEPMLHRRRLPELLAALRARDVQHITIETNATIWEPSLGREVDLWSLSPKLPGSGEVPDARTVERYLVGAAGRVQLKFVVTDAADLEAMWSLLEGVSAPLPVPVYVQPDGTRDDYDVAVRELADNVMADDVMRRGVPRRSLVRVATQVHRVAWGAHARGV